MPEPDAQRDGPLRRRDPRGERRPQGWRAQGASDGHGTPPPRRSVSFLPWILVLLFMLVLNSVFASSLGSTSARVTVPYSPTFLSEVQHGNVASIASTGDTVQGTFRKAVRYPSSSTAAPTKSFSTQLPAFATTARCCACSNRRGS